MENKSFSLEQLSKTIFTESNTSDFDKEQSKKASIKWVLKAISTGTESYDDFVSYLKTGNLENIHTAFCKLKDNEQCVSKDILISIFKANRDLKELLGRTPPKMTVLQFKNLNNSDVPSFKKIDHILFKINRTLDNYSKFVSTEMVNQFKIALEEHMGKLRYANEYMTDSLLDLERGTTEDQSDFIMNAIRFYQDKDIEGVEYEYPELDEVNEFIDSVKTYNANIIKVMRRVLLLEKRMSSIEIKCSDNDVSAETQDMLRQLKLQFMEYVYKYIRSANILYSIKGNYIKKFLFPAQYAQIHTIEKTEVADEIDPLEESFNTVLEASLFVDRFDYTSESLILEQEMVNMRNHEILLEDEAEKEAPPNVAVASGSGDSSSTGGEQSVNELKEKSSKIIKNINNIYNKIKESVVSLFSTKKKDVKGLLNDRATMDLIKKHLDESSDGAVFEIRNKDDAKVTVARINNIKIPAFDEKLAESVRTVEKSQQRMAMVKEILPELKTSKNMTGENLLFYLKNYFAGYDISEIDKYAEKAENNDIVTSIKSIASLKQSGVDSIMKSVSSANDDMFLNKVETAIRSINVVVSKMASNAQREAVDAPKLAQDILMEYFSEAEVKAILNEEEAAASKPAPATAAPKPSAPTNTTASRPATPAVNNTAPKPNSATNVNQPAQNNKKIPDTTKEIIELSAVYGDIANKITSSGAEALKIAYIDYMNICTLLKTGPVKAANEVQKNEPEENEEQQPSEEK